MRVLAKLKETARTAVIAVLRAYKFAISPLFPPACRYVPSCSEYAIEAVDRHGIFRGLTLAVWRLLRCHPFVKGGFDPVPLQGPDSGASLRRTAPSTSLRAGSGSCPHVSTTH